MSDWVALLRGVNVGGVTVRSAELGALFAELGFGSVRTVLATGNVLFSAGGGASPAERLALKASIEAALGERFGYDAWVVLEPRERMGQVVEAYPFEEDAAHHAYVVFGSDQGVLDELLALGDEALPAAGSPAHAAAGAAATGSTAGSTAHLGGLGADEERLAAGDGVLYWACPRGSSTNTFFAKLSSKAKFKPHITTRNLNTVRKLL